MEKLTAYRGTVRCKRERKVAVNLICMLHNLLTKIIAVGNTCWKGFPEVTVKWLHPFGARVTSQSGCRWWFQTQSLGLMFRESMAKLSNKKKKVLTDNGIAEITAKSCLFTSCTIYIYLYIYITPKSLSYKGQKGKQMRRD